MVRVNDRVPHAEFKMRAGNEWVTRTTGDLFDKRRIALFALPGAFTPTCSEYQLPGYENFYDDLLALGVDDVYCISVNDVFVMRSWAKDLSVRDVKLIPDGNGDFTRGMGMLVNKSNLGFGERSWRYSAIVDDGVIEQIWVEPGKKDNCPTDPFEVSDVNTMISYLKLRNMDLKQER